MAGDDRDSDLDGFLRALIRDGARDSREPPADPPALDLVAGRYRLVRLLGRGGMGAVHAAIRQGDGASVAVKLLRESVRDRESVERFQREARAASVLEHPHIVRVLDYGIDTERPFLVMELLHGETLGDVLEREPRLSVERSLAIAESLASALEAAHERGVVHRDVKPENVFLASAPGGSTLKLLDFGIAKLHGAPVSALTRSGTRLGTPAYMAPEQVRSSRSVDAACDQYALAVVLFELLSGELPHEGHSAEAMLRAKLAAPPRELHALRPELPGTLAAAVMRALSAHPNDRFASISEFRSAFAS